MVCVKNLQSLARGSGRADRANHSARKGFRSRLRRGIMSDTEGGKICAQCHTDRLLPFGKSRPQGCSSMARYSALIGRVVLLSENAALALAAAHVPLPLPHERAAAAPTGHSVAQRAARQNVLLQQELPGSLQLGPLEQLPAQDSAPGMPPGAPPPQMPRYRSRRWARCRARARARRLARPSSASLQRGARAGGAGQWGAAGWTRAPTASAGTARRRCLPGAARASVGQARRRWRPGRGQQRRRQRSRRARCAWRAGRGQQRWRQGSGRARRAWRAGQAQRYQSWQQRRQQLLLRGQKHAECVLQPTWRQRTSRPWRQKWHTLACHLRQPPCQPSKPHAKQSQSCIWWCLQASFSTCWLWK